VGCGFGVGVGVGVGVGDGVGVGADLLVGERAGDLVDALVDARAGARAGRLRERGYYDATTDADPAISAAAVTASGIATDMVTRPATVIFTTSPLLLDRAHRVAFVEDGRVVAVGAHRDLLASQPRYTAVVTREEDEG
jgi:putative ABC transport system ATP-binding protein